MWTPTVRRLALAVGLLLLPCVANAGQVVVEYPRNTNGVVIDHCYHWAKDCDQYAADKVCQALGHSHAVDFRWQLMEPTYVLGTGQTCTGHCGGFTRVICETGRGGGGGGGARSCATDNDCPGSICLLGVCAN
ncbi:hypothetical protein [Roseospirillum parvum]|nr:hypothetical protein [Roseospirillum parvum]